MENKPLVTINILSFNRKDELRKTLTKVYGQDYKNIEVIVVDNASSDGSPEMVVKDFPVVRLIKLEKNIGIAGWNEGFRVAKGEYVLVLDDDSYPGENAIDNSVRIFKEIKDVGIVSSIIFNTADGYYQNGNWEEGYVKSFIGCGALINKKLFHLVGGFNERLFLYFHEVDFSIRIYDMGYKIYFIKNSIINHNYSKTNRRIIKSNSTDKRKIFYDTRNVLLILLMYFNLHKIFFRILRITMGKIIVGFKYKSFFTVISAITSVILYLPLILKNRLVVNMTTQEYYEYGAIFGGFFFEYGNYHLKKGDF